MGEHSITDYCKGGRIMKDNNQGRNSFVFYRSFADCINTCPPEVQLTLYRAVVDYALDQVPPTFNDDRNGAFLTAIWAVIVPQLDANTRRYLNGCKGGCPSGITKPTMKGNQNARKQNQNKTKTKPNVNVNDNDNVNDNVVIPFESALFRETWDVLRRQPKWRTKTTTALQKCLDQLSQYPEPFAVDLMNTAIANNYQGVVFSSTPRDFETWRREHPETKKTTPQPITSFDEL